MRRSAHCSTAEARWSSWPALSAAPAVSIEELLGDAQRVVVIAPHPDDEVLSMGGMISLLVRAGRRVEIIAVTDGEKSHVPSKAWSAVRLAQARTAESIAAIAHLGVTAASTLRLRLPDGNVADRHKAFGQALRNRLQPTDAVFATWEHDGHPDHEATGRAARMAAQAAGCSAIEVPIWTWARMKPGCTAFPLHRLRRLPLDEQAMSAKAAALQEFTTQRARIRGAIHTPILPARVLAHFERHYESFFV